MCQDLSNNIKMGSEVLAILLKKRLAINGKLHKSKKLLESHVDRVESINQHYKILRDKLDKEWQEELATIEDDRMVNLRNYKSLQLRFAEVEHKIEQYRVEDENLKLDRWSLDSRLYYEK